MKKIIFGFILLLAAYSNTFSQEKTIHPEEIWADQHGEHVQAHGGGIIKIADTYYWYGEQRRQGLDAKLR